VRPHSRQAPQSDRPDDVQTDRAGHSVPTETYGVNEPRPLGWRGRHVNGSRRRFWLILVPIVAMVSALVANVASGSVQRPIHYKVTAPITVQALGADLSEAPVGDVVTAGAKLVAERPTTLRYLVIAVRDQAGRIYDFPRAENVTVGTSQREVTAQRTFDKPGTYTYWVAFFKNGTWTKLSPTDTITIVDGGGATPAPSPTTASPSPEPSPSPTATSTSSPAAPAGGEFPNAANTGVPPGVALSDYTGPCTITKNDTVIDAKTVNCDLQIRATGVVITRSRVNGEINGGEGTGSSFRVEDSEIVNPARQACQCIGSDNFTVLRTEIRGGNRGVYCRLNCTVADSWIHGTALLATQHASAVRVEQYATVRHNTLACDWTALTDSEIGCSADMTGYPDFAAITHNTITGNLFAANPTGTGFCAYGGATGGKPFSGAATNATYIRFVDNVWQRGANGKCGTYGPITGFDAGRTGNEWTNNRFADGAIIPAEK
jgi:hypothetical protein